MDNSVVCNNIFITISKYMYIWSAIFVNMWGAKLKYTQLFISNIRISTLKYISQISYLPAAWVGSICAWSIERGGATIAGSVRERSNGGGTRRTPALAATAAALWQCDNFYTSYLNIILQWLFKYFFKFIPKYMLCKQVTKPRRRRLSIRSVFFPFRVSNIGKLND